MTEIALGKWRHYHQIIFNANKMAKSFESIFSFSQAPTILSHTLLYHIQALNIPPRIYHKWKVGNEKYKNVLTFLTLIFGFSFEVIKEIKV